MVALNPTRGVVILSSDFHGQSVVEKYKKLDEIPFDFTRRMMSVLIQDPEGKAILLTKGAPEEVFHQCSHFELDGKLSPMDPNLMVGLKEEYASLSNDGFRVLAVAKKELPGKQACLKDDERELVLKGYVAFLDPPKNTAGRAIEALHNHGVAVKILTGDNQLISRKVCKDVGLSADTMLLGGDVEKMSDTELADAAEKTMLFARLSPAHKRRVIQVLRGKGHVVGFMGDGINDAPALKAADIGISVDTATDIAKESADLILLEKDLMVLEGGVIEGRKVFANILKYIRMGASSNFGNMFSVLGASAFLPFLPMAAD
jgi:Mg2+-importing ATPase